jgi:FAD synthetase
VYLEGQRIPKAILVWHKADGSARAELDALQRDGSGAAGFMLVHPVIDWHYAEIWAVSFNWLRLTWTGETDARHFIRYYVIPYCSLYDRIYTTG